ncbi:hypothetical protein B0H21DRAFT_869072, partial [Amylocystis lapponica]
IKKSDVCPGYKVLDTSNRAEKHNKSRQKVDGGLYLNAEKPKSNRNCWFNQRVSFEWKRSDIEDNPFDDTPGHAFEATSELRKKNCGQIISYASEVLMRQHRCFHFTVVVFGLYAHIIRWDRSGAIVTKRINYKDEPHILCSFLWQFCHLSDEKQGYDSTAVLVEKGTPDFAVMKRASEKKVKTRSRVTKSARWKERTRSLEDTSSPSAERSTCWFLVNKPHFMAQGPTGRGTRGYDALDCVTGKFMFLKDTWRVDTDGFEKEGAVLKALNNAEVQNIPTVICHGDVRNQHTITHEYWLYPDPDAQNPMKGHAHYCLVEEEVGCSLSQFNTGQFLLKIVVDCLGAHEDAYTKLGILHRDVSAGNMLIVYRRVP